MKKIKQMKWLLPILLQFCFAHANAQLNVGEYFFDTDPGVGNGIPITTQSVLAGPIYDSTESTSTINIPSWMAPGVHTLYVRYGDFNNINGRNWSNYEARKFTVNPPSGNGFAQAEYFFDTDPGLGNATSLPLTGNPDSSDFAGNVSTTGLTPGQHTLHVRAKTATGFWGHYETRKVIINVANGSNIVEAEYFYDVDPGIGNATNIVVSGNTDSSDFAGNVSTTGLSLGIHQLCIRAKKANGEWSNYETRKVKILSNGYAIDKMEYFYDTDPGVGNGINLAIQPNGDSSEYAGNIPTIGLSSGAHFLCVRSRNIEGHWSIYEQKKVQVRTEPVLAEYFFNTDPGVGNGTALNLTDLGNGEAEFTGGAITDINLPYGAHKMYVRSKDNAGHWGQYDSLSLFINCKNPGLPIITQSAMTTQCGVQGVTLSVTADSLNDASYWNWYSGSCGGTLIDTGLSVFVSPSDTATYYIRGEGGCVVNAPCSDVIVNFDPTGLLELKVFIQGYYTTSNTMTTTLFNQGQATCSNVTDTIIVELHDPITYTLVTSQQVILKTNGIARCDFGAYQGAYYVAVKHRNSIETWSANPIVLDNEMVQYDFSSAATQAYGDNQVAVETSVFAIYSGDINQDGLVDNLDYSIWEMHSNNFDTGYLSADLNGLGSVDNGDYLYWELSSNNFISVSKP